MLSHKSSATTSYGGGSSEGPIIDSSAADRHRFLRRHSMSATGASWPGAQRDSTTHTRPYSMGSATASQIGSKAGPRRSASNGPPLSPVSASPHSSAKGHGHTVPRARNGHVRRKVHRVMSWDNPTIPTLFTHTDPEVGSFGFCASPYSRTSDRLVSRRTSPHLVCRETRRIRSCLTGRLTQRRLRSQTRPPD